MQCFLYLFRICTFLTNPRTDGKGCTAYDVIINTSFYTQLKACWHDRYNKVIDGVTGA